MLLRLRSDGSFPYSSLSFNPTYAIYKLPPGGRGPLAENPRPRRGELAQLQDRSAHSKSAVPTWHWGLRLQRPHSGRARPVIQAELRCLRVPKKT